MKTTTRNQLIALPLTVLTCIVLVGFLFVEIIILNRFSSDDISLHVRLGDILIGLTIYLKTSIDFAMFIGRLMEKNPGLKGRIGIEIGTAVGNAAGTFGILLVWTFFKEVNWLLAIMIFVAALVLIRLAQDGLEHIDTGNTSYPKAFRNSVSVFDACLRFVNRGLDPVLSRLIPSRSLKVTKRVGIWSLLALAFTVPFILGLDDFAGYVPLFSVVNVFGFAIGVFVGHMILNIFLFISPKRTIKAVKNPIISLLGSIAFIILAAWGLIEAFKLLFLHH
jgi:hypothetical protein